MQISPNHPARRRALGLFLAAAGSLALVLGGVPTALAARAKTTLISLNPAGEQVIGPSSLPSVSGDGRFVAFQSDVTPLPNAAGSFVRDRKTATTRLVSSSGFQPSISADGRFVAYSAFDFDENVFLADLRTGETELVSQNTAGQPAGGFSASPSISAGGRFVAFSSDAQNLTPLAPRMRRNEFVRDMKTGKIVQVNVNSAGKPGNGPCHHPSISAGGRYVAFESNASNLAPGAKEGRWNIFVRDLRRHKTTLASVNSAAKAANGASHNPSISGDGRYVAFESKASNLVAHDTNKAWDVFRRDLKGHRTKRISVSSQGKQGNGDSRFASLSNHGGFIAFVSGASNLVRGDTNHVADVFLRDEHSGRTVRIDVSSTGHQANRPPLAPPAVSADGRFVAFSSPASNLVPGDTNLNSDIFIRGPLR
jgi:Tol biopolymer transport system component